VLDGDQSVRSSSTGIGSELEALRRSARKSRSSKVQENARETRKLSQMIDLFQSTLTRLQSTGATSAERRATLEAVLSLVRCLQRSVCTERSLQHARAM
jgi:Leucine-rich repeat (LRR) protein